MPRNLGYWLVMALVLAGCGGGDSAETTVTAAVPAATTTTEAVVATTTTAPMSTSTSSAPAVTTTAAAGASASSDCLVGTWNPDQTELEDFLLTLYRPYAADASLDAGTIDLILGADGSFAQNYNGVQGSGTAAGNAVTMEFTGGSFGTYEVSGNELTINFEGSDIGAVVNGLPVTAPSIPTASVSASFSCDADDLTVEPPPNTPGALWPLPRHWSRAG